MHGLHFAKNSINNQTRQLRFSFFLIPCIKAIGAIQQNSPTEITQPSSESADLSGKCKQQGGGSRISERVAELGGNRSAPSIHQSEAGNDLSVFGQTFHYRCSRFRFGG
ncbi:hypothetical protein CDAR_608561 [Caerostris darwini]|uniref:Uncharacterized protein n=1 Tax=Caerostris darwini TaxID=1538125 RepID=A0AAV4WMK0_9ARAC|nr:hypothetical protein CDAR_608561 [Caerostris darwini]